MRIARIRRKEIGKSKIGISAITFHMDGSLQHRELTEHIIRVFYDVYNELGFGFLESVYEIAMMIALNSDGIRTEQQVAIPVHFRGQVLGAFAADIIVERTIIVEIKAVSQLIEAHTAQILNYLKATEIEVGLVMNFGSRPEFKRRAFENRRKTGSIVSAPIMENIFPNS